MAITVSFRNGPSFRIEGDAATIGSDPACSISLPGDVRLKSQHALLRLVAGRWMIESKSGEEIRVGDEPPSKVKWLNLGDTVDLTGHGPQLTIQASGSSASATVVTAWSAGASSRASVVDDGSAAGPLSASTAQPHLRKAPLLWVCTGIILCVLALIAASLVPPSTRKHEAERGLAKKQGAAADTNLNVVSATDGGTSSRASALPGDSSPAAAQPPAAAPEMTIDRLRDSLYSVTLKAPGHDQTYRLGTAGAISPTSLVTSAAIAIELENAKDTLPAVFVRSADSLHEYEVTATKVHPAYRTAVAAADRATDELRTLHLEMEKNPEQAKEGESAKKQVAAAQRLQLAFETQVTYDLAVIEVKGPLAKPLELALNVAPSAGTGVWLAGLPFKSDEFLVDRDQPGLVRRVKGSIFLRRPLPQAAESALRLLATVSEDLADQNWVGCPVFNAAGKIIAVYSRPTPQFPAGDDEPHPPTHELSEIVQIKDLLPHQ